MDADKPAQRKSYAGNTTLEIFEVLWRHSYFGHGLTVRQILDELARKHQLEDPSELPTETRQSYPISHQPRHHGRPHR